MEFVHKSIMLEEVIESLAIKPNGIYVDGTLGGAGHSSEIVKRLGEDGRLIGIDQDGEAIEAATKRLKPYKDKVTIVRSNYAQMKEVLRDLGIPKVDGILLDLGVSSYQLDNAERGFTYREDVPLDMRMDQRQTKTAKDIVNDYSEMELYHIIRNYGEDKFAKNIAKHIVQARQKAPIETTGQLIEVIKAAIPKKVRATGGHPAKKTFQAIRIELNHELDVLKNNLEDMIDLLNDEGRIAIITFHSLEDRRFSVPVRGRVFARRNFRFVYVAEYQRERLSQGNQLCLVRKSLRRTVGLRVQSFVFLRGESQKDRDILSCWR